MINKTLDKPSTRAVTEAKFRANSGQMGLRVLDTNDDCGVGASSSDTAFERNRSPARILHFIAELPEVLATQNLSEQVARVLLQHTSELGRARTILFFPLGRVAFGPHPRSSSQSRLIDDLILQHRFASPDTRQ